MDQRSVRLSILATRAIARKLDDAKLVATAITGNQLRRAVDQNISAPAVGGTPATHAAFLRAADHPYARRHGSIQYRARGGSPGFSHPEAVVHTVSGQMRNALVGKVDRRNTVYTLRLDVNKAPHARYVILGTRVLLPRDVIGLTSLDPTVQDQMRRTWIRILGPVFRTQAITRFG